MATMYSGIERSALAEAFQESLTGIDKIEKLPPDFAAEQRDGQFVDARAAGIFQDPGLYFEDVPLRPGEGGLEFRYMPNLERGKEDSVNQVFFGEITVLDAAAAVTPLTVAVKRRFSMGALAVHEYGVYKHVNSSGLIATFPPLGFAVTKSKKDDTPSIHLLTLFEPDVESFDNQPWEITAADIDEPTLKIERRLHRLGWAGMYLAAAHSIGLVHGDAQSKNIAISTRTERPMLTDLEGSSTLKDSEGNWRATEYDILKAYQKDITVFIKSIRRVGFLRGAGHAAMKQVLNQYFFAPYGARLGHPSSYVHDLGTLNVQELINNIAQATFEQLEQEET